MYILQMPDPINASNVQRVTLDGVDYTLRLVWNSRAGWYLGLSDPATDEAIFSPVRVRVGWDFLWGVTHDRRPPGMLVAADTSNSMMPPGYDDWDSRVKLVYVPLEELA